MKTEVKLITPKIAEEMLKHNNMNRLIQRDKVIEYSRSMSCGLWREETGESIKIANDGTLLDGQQRLLALIKAGVSLTFLLVTELEKDVFKVIDTGKTRTAGDIFSIAGVPNARNTAAAIGRYLDLKKGTTSLGEGKNLLTIKATKSELLSLYNQRDKFWIGTMTMSQDWYRHNSRILKISENAGLFAFFYDINNDDAYTFMYWYRFIGEKSHKTIERKIIVCK